MGSLGCGLAATQNKALQWRSLYSHGIRSQEYALLLFGLLPMFRGNSPLLRLLHIVRHSKKWIVTSYWKTKAACNLFLSIDCRIHTNVGTSFGSDFHCGGMGSTVGPLGRRCLESFSGEGEMTDVVCYLLLVRHSVWSHVTNSYGVFTVLSGSRRCSADVVFSVR